MIAQQTSRGSCSPADSAVIRCPTQWVAQDPSLGSLGSLAAVAALTCGGARLVPATSPGRSPLFPVVPRRIWHANGTVPSPRSPVGGARPPECLSLDRRQLGSGRLAVSLGSGC